MNKGDFVTIEELEPGYSYFCHHISETAEQQIQRQIRQGKDTNRLAEIVGIWPGEETDEEFEDMLKMLQS